MEDMFLNSLFVYSFVKILISTETCMCQILHVKNSRSMNGLVN